MNVASRLHLEAPLPVTGADSLALAQDLILAPAGLDQGHLSDALGTVMGHAVDYADLYFQLSREESWALEDGIVKEGTQSIEQGVGVRALAGEKTGFAYSDEIILPALTEASRAARAIARSGSSHTVASRHALSAHRLYLPIDPLAGTTDTDKVSLLEQMDAEARRLDPRVKQVMASLSGVHEVIMVMSSDGTLAADVRPLVRMNVSVIVEQMVVASRAIAAPADDSACLTDGDRWQALVAKRCAGAVNLDASPAPAGAMTVVLGPGWPGILLHEAIGHGLEGDFNRKGTSAFCGRIGERVASELAPSSMTARCRASRFAEHRRRRHAHPLHDADRERRPEGLPAGQAQCSPDGCAVHRQRPARVFRAHDAAAHDQYLHACPAPRPGGDHCLGAEGPLLRELRRRPGRYHLRQVRVLGERGVPDRERASITAPVKGATLIGNGPDVLTRVAMVGNDLELDAGVGTCGKDGQEVPVGVGQPTLRIDGLTVGGTAT